MSMEMTARPSRIGSLVDRANKPILALILCLVLIGIFRFSLIDTGHFYWSDERCYLPTFAFVDALANGEWHVAAEELFDARRSIPAARPGFLLFSVFPVLAQRIINPMLGIHPQTPNYYDVACAFNVLVTLAITVCIFAIGRIWTGRPWYALLMALTYSLLCNANVWIRHQAPYPESLLLFLVALWLLSSAPRGKGHNTWRIVLAGVLSALGYACYPGHYVFVVINGVVALSLSRRRIVSGMLYSAGSLCVIAILELLSWTVGRSYLMDQRALASSATMGDPKEGFVFLWHYLRDVEGVVGVLLIALFGWFAVLFVRRSQLSIPPVARAAILTAVAGYIFHASMGVFFGKMVFYGRVLMIYLPFLVGGAVLAIMHLKHVAIRRVAVGSLLLASVYSFATFATQYSRIVYPAEFLQETMTRLERDIIYPPNVLWGYVSGQWESTVEYYDPDMVNVTDSKPKGSDVYTWLAAHDDAVASGAQFIAVNTKFMWYIRSRYDRFEHPEGYQLIAEAPHASLLAASGFEGSKPWERNRIRKRQYSMRIYQRTPVQKALTMGGSGGHVGADE